jgi:hypothetical protein
VFVILSFLSTNFEAMAITGMIIASYSRIINPDLSCHCGAGSQHGCDMGFRFEGDAMGEVQGILHVQPSLSSTEGEDNYLPNCHDSLRSLGISWDSGTLGCVTSPSAFLLLRPFTDYSFLQTDYIDQQDRITTQSHAQAHVHNVDFVGIASYNIFVGIMVATIFGSGFFFDLFWPERRESQSVRLAWKICSVVVSFMALAGAIVLTVRCPILFTSMSRADAYIHRLFLQHVEYTSQGYQKQKQAFYSDKIAHRPQYTAIMVNVLLQRSYYGPGW